MIGRLWAMLTRALLLLFGLAMFLGVMALGAVAAVGLAVWALLRGRPVVPLDFGWKGPVQWRAGARRQRPGPGSDAEVVDIDARVIDKPAAPSADNERTGG